MNATESELDDLLRDLLDFTHIMARSLQSSPTDEVPRSLGPIIKFKRLPPRARTTVRRALEDDGFRAAIATRADEDEVGLAGMLFLTRPPEWDDNLDLLIEEKRTHAQSVGNDDLTAALDVVTAQRDQLETELRAAAESAAQADARSEQLARDLARQSDELDRIASHNEQLSSERMTAVREWKNLERKASEWRAENLRLIAELSALKVELADRDSLLSDLRSHGGADSTDGATSEMADVEPAPNPEVIAAVTDIENRLAELQRDVGRLRDDVGLPEAGLPEAGEAGTAQRSSSSTVGEQRTEGSGQRRTSRGRRVPQRIGRGLHEDSAEAVRWLLTLDAAHVLIDGYNVSMLAWPALRGNEQRDRLVRSTESLGSIFGASFHIVFDGDGEGGRPHRGGVGSNVRVSFTPSGYEADDEILKRVRELDAHLPVVVVSNDRRVREGAQQGGANVVSSTRFVELF